MSNPVLIVGAGPTGLMLACQLLRRGVPVRVVDKAPAPTNLSKAIAIHARTLELLEPLGLTAELLEHGNRLTSMCAYSNGKPLVSATFDEIDSRFRFVLAVPQSETEALLTRKLTSLGGAIERDMELVAVAQSPNETTVTLRGKDGREEQVTTPWLCGCDGAHSTVRDKLGIPFVGKGYEDQFVLGDVKLEGELPRHQMTSFLDPDGILAFFPLPADRWRLIASAARGADSDDKPTLDELQGMVDRRAHVKLRLFDDVWRGRFRIHCRQVRRYRHGRVFLCGDAAHIHSPVGGQGMNTGMQDAHNLAWKLALVWRGRGGEELLDSYHEERHSVGAQVLRSTDLATRAATMQQPIVRAIRDRLAPLLSSLEVVQQRMTRATAEIDLTYRKSSIVGERRATLLGTRPGGSDHAAESPNLASWYAFGEAPRAGDRAPDGRVQVPGRDGASWLMETVDDRAHTLLLFDGRAATPAGYERLASVARAVKAKLGDDVNVRVVVPAGAALPEALDPAMILEDVAGELEKRYGARAECAYVVRPDLYVGYRSQPALEDGILEHFDAIIRA